MGGWVGRGFGVALAIPNSLFGIRAEFFGIRMRHDEGYSQVYDFKRKRKPNITDVKGGGSMPILFENEGIGSLFESGFLIKPNKDS